MHYKVIDAPVAVAEPGTVTISQASPALVGKVTHGLLAGTGLTFSTSGTGLPAGLTAGVVYYVKSGATLLANSFALVDSNGNTITTTSAGNGTFTATLAPVLTINTESIRTLGVEVTNSGPTNALDVFDVFGKMHPDGTSLALLSSGASYTTPTYPCIRASGSPVALAAGSSAWFILDVSAFSEVSFKASCATAAVKVNVLATSKVYDL